MSDNRTKALSRSALEAAAREAKAERDRLFEDGRRLGQDWTKFYLALAAFQNSVRVGRRKYELCGYGTWEEFIADLTQRIGESRSELLAKLSAIQALPAGTVLELGKVKSFQAVRLVRAGKWSPAWEAKLKAMDAEQAKEAVRQAVGTSPNGHFKLVEILRTGQEAIWQAEKERIKMLLASDSNEAFWDFLLGLLQQLPDEEVTGRQAK